jgi:hypothetical protein
VCFAALSSHDRLGHLGMQGQYRWDIRWVSPAEPAFSCHAELVLNAALGGGDAAPRPLRRAYACSRAAPIPEVLGWGFRA